MEFRRSALAGVVVSETLQRSPGAREHGGVSAAEPLGTARCRFCQAPLETVFADLGSSPLANSYIAPERLGSMEPFYPLRARVCGNCFLVQLEEYESPEQIFSDYAYFSSYSKSWLEHCRLYVEAVTARLALGPGSQVVEIA